MKFSEISWWPDQAAHFVESMAATVFGFAVMGEPAGGAATGFVMVVTKEGEDFFYKWRSGKWAAGDVLDLVIHLLGVSIPLAILYALT